MRVATLNVWALPGSLSPHVNARMEAIGERLPELALDVAAFQEVWTEEAAEILVAAGRGAGLVHRWHSGTAMGGGGLLVLTRLPILRARFEPFHIRGLPQGLRHIDYFGGKGFALLRLDTRAGPLTVIDTHLQARYRRDVSHEYRAHRTGQVVQLAIRARESADPVLALGDFNFAEKDPEYAVLTGLTGLRDVAAELDRREPTRLAAIPYRGLHPRTRRIDMIFTRDGSGSRVIPRAAERVLDEPLELERGRVGYSDHAGVLAELEIARVEGAPIEPPPPESAALLLASRLLAQGRAAAERRRRGGRVWAGAGLGGAALATAGLRAPTVTRRRLLRASLIGAGVIGVAPCVGMSILTEVFVPNEIRAFDRLAARLAEFEREREAESLAARARDGRGS